jgi:CubicO group peptidase (beta-lactamase class C family)
MPSRPRLLAPLIVLACLAGTAQAQTDPRATQVEHGLLPAVLTPRTVPMDLLVRMRQLQVPGLSLAVVDHGQLAWAHAWGMAQAGQAMRTDTLLQAASISKALTSVAALQLVEQGRLGLDSDINPALRSWQIPPGAQTVDKPVTLRRLLSHSAGFSVSGFQGYSVGTPLPTLLQVLDGQPPANSAPVRVEIPPGTEWRYSGGGFTVLQQLLQDVSGEGFAPLLQQAVLTPAGMTRSSFEVPAEHAVGHQQGQPIAGCYRLHPELAAAGLWTSPSDLARFSIALPHLLTSAMLKAALSPQFDQSGLGFVLDPANGRFGHDGSNRGFESRWLADAKDGGRAVIVMANANGTRTLMNEVIRAMD